MSSSDEPQHSAGVAADPGPDGTAAARTLLARIEARVFPATAIPPARHTDLIRRAARRLFGHGR